MFFYSEEDAFCVIKNLCDESHSCRVLGRQCVRHRYLNILLASKCVWIPAAEISKWEAGTWTATVWVIEKEADKQSHIVQSISLWWRCRAKAQNITNAEPLWAPLAPLLLFPLRCCDITLICVPTYDKKEHSEFLKAAVRAAPLIPDDWLR